MTDPKILQAATHAAATIGAIYQWLDMVDAEGGATNIAGVAKCHAMLKSLRDNRARTERLIMEPLRAAIKEMEK